MTNTALTEYPSCRGISAARRASIPYRNITGMLVKGLMPNHLFATAYMREFMMRTTPLPLADDPETAPLVLMGRMGQSVRLAGGTRRLCSSPNR